MSHIISTNVGRGVATLQRLTNRYKKGKHRNIKIIMVLYVTKQLCTWKKYF